MNNIERLVLNRIKYFQMEYPEGVPVKILKLDLDLSDDELKQTILDLEDQRMIFIEDEYVKLVCKTTNKLSEDMEHMELETSEQPIKEDKIYHNLTGNELKAFQLIKELADESNNISRLILEGNLMYGDLKLSTLGTYNMIMFLENKRLIKKIKKADGEYFTIQ